MKILVVTQYFYPEEFKINDLVKGLVDRGHEVVVLTCKPNYPEVAGKLKYVDPKCQMIKDAKTIGISFGE